MIFKIGHICYCGDAFQAKKKLSQCGYRPLFSERVSPMGITQGFLSINVEEFGMSLWTRHGSISIELLDFESYSHNSGLIHPLISAKMPGAVPAVNDKKSFVLNNSEYFPGLFLGYPAYMKLNALCAEPVMDSFIVFSPDIDKSVYFWSMVGLNCIEQSDMHGVFYLRCAFTRKDFFLHIYKSNRELVYEYIDSLGFHVLGLISNSAVYEHEKMMSSGMEVTPIEQITINEKRLNVFYSRSPEGLIAEIISLN